jgi:hypothetical protein
MAPLYPTQLPRHRALVADAAILRRMRKDIESIWHTLRGSRLTIEDARKAIARADKTLVRRLAERRLGT